VDEDNRFSEKRAKAQALRDELFRRASIGELTGDQADVEAVRLGLGSLSRRPGPEEFRPEIETHWTLSMAVAWITYLDLDEVREWSAALSGGVFSTSDGNAGESGSTHRCTRADDLLRQGRSREDRRQ
jgi:hypothetical protein